MVEATSSLPPIRYWVDVILTTAWQCQRFDSERLERLRPQPAGKTGGEHAYPDAFDDPPDAIKLLLVDHKGAFDKACRRKARPVRAIARPPDQLPAQASREDRVGFPRSSERTVPPWATKGV
jgi:hypothetical protein